MLLEDNIGSCMLAYAYSKFTHTLGFIALPVATTPGNSHELWTVATATLAQYFAAVYMLTIRSGEI